MQFTKTKQNYLQIDEKNEAKEYMRTLRRNVQRDINVHGIKHVSNICSKLYITV